MSWILDDGAFCRGDVAGNWCLSFRRGKNLACRFRVLRNFQCDSTTVWGVKNVAFWWMT